MGLARELCSDGEARKGLLCGMRQLIRAVGVTLGPSGRSVMLGQAFAPPHVVLDGVEVAKTITLEHRWKIPGHGICVLLWNRWKKK